MSPDQTTVAEQLAAIETVDKLNRSVEHLHPSYGTVRAALKWLRQHVHNRERNRLIGKEFEAALRRQDLDFTQLTHEQIGDMIRDAVHARGYVIEPQPATGESDRA